MVLLLGATGLLGRNVLNLLLERGIPVRVLVRHPLEADGPEMVLGSILDLPTLQKSAEGCSAVINCAGTTDMTLPRLEDFLPVNRDLVTLLCRVMDRMPGLETLIHVSSANTVASGTREHPSDESVPIGPPYDRSPYALSKLEGERILQKYAAEHTEKRIFIMNPGFLLGPFDAKPSSGELMLAAWRKPLMVATRAGKSFLHVRDAAAAIVNALSQGTPGRYLLTGEYISYADFYALQARVCGYRQRFLALPDWTVKLIGGLGDFLKALGFKVSFYSHNLNQLLVEEWYSCEKARRELDYPQTPVSEAIADFFRWRDSSLRSE